jgi:hypothetical protein
MSVNLNSESQLRLASAGHHDFQVCASKESLEKVIVLTSKLPKRGLVVVVVVQARNPESFEFPEFSEFVRW